MSERNNENNGHRSVLWRKCLLELRYVNEALASLDGLRLYMPKAFRLAIQRIDAEIWLMVTSKVGTIDIMPEVLWEDYLDWLIGEKGERKFGGDQSAPLMKYFVTKPHRTRWTIPSTLSISSGIYGGGLDVHLLPEQAFIRVWNAEERRKSISHLLGR